MCTEKIQISSEVTLGIHTSGFYTFLEMINDKPAYKHEAADLYLFYAGWWKVDTGELFQGDDRAATVGFIRSEEDVACPDNVEPGHWKYYENTLLHEAISVTQGQNHAFSPTSILNKYYSH